MLHNATSSTTLATSSATARTGIRLAASVTVIRFGGEEDDFFMVKELRSFRGSNPLLT
jgi:hypothetical protein